MRRMNFYNKEKNDSTLQTLAGALSNSKKTTNINTGSVIPTRQTSGSQNEDNTEQGAYQLGKGLAKLYSAGKEKGWFDFGSNSANDSIASSSLDMSLGSNEGLSFLRGGAGNNIDNLSFLNSGAGAGAGGIDNLSFANLGSAADTGSAASSAGSSGGWGGFGGSGGGGMPWGAIAGVAKQGYNYITDKNPSEYSDIEQSTIYPLQGAAIGGSYGGGWGALGGLLYGLGYSLKDEAGLKDNDWLTTVLLPIGMGDEHKGIIQV